jgi:hypothetical protein
MLISLPLVGLFNIIVSSVFSLYSNNGTIVVYLEIPKKSETVSKVIEKVTR